MGRQSVCVWAIALVSFMAGGCTSLYQHQLATIPSGSRVGVLLVDGGGDRSIQTMYQPYVYEVLAERRLIPVALNDGNVKPLLRSATFGSAPGADRAPTGDVALLTTLKQHLTTHKVSYLLLLHLWTSGKDEDLRAVVVKVSDMSVVASRFYRYRAMAACWSGLTPILGLGLVVCPWFYTVNADRNNRQMLRDFLGTIVR